MEVTGNHDKNAKEKILQVTVDLIKSNRLSTLTVRQISQAAHVNVGAINYYFGAKENLLHIAAREILQSIKATFLTLDDIELPPKERIRNFLTVFAGNHSIYIDCVRWMVSKKDLSFQNDYEYSVYLKEFGFEKLKTTMTEITGETDSVKLRVLSIQLMCAAVGPNIAIPSICHTELPNVEEQVDILLTHFFSNN